MTETLQKHKLSHITVAIVKALFDPSACNQTSFILSTKGGNPPIERPAIIAPIKVYGIYLP